MAGRFRAYAETGNSRLANRRGGGVLNGNTARIFNRGADIGLAMCLGPAGLAGARRQRWTAGAATTATTATTARALKPCCSSPSALPDALACWPGRTRRSLKAQQPPRQGTDNDTRDGDHGTPKPRRLFPLTLVRKRTHVTVY